MLLKGSKKLHNWLYHNRIFGPIIRDYEEHRGTRKTTKIKALTIMWAAVTTSAFLFLNSLILQAIIFTIAVIGTISMLRIKTIE